MYLRNLQGEPENDFFTLLYPLLALFGGVVGLNAAWSWGGFKSYLGKSLIFFSLGLLFQFLGQALYAYYIYIAGIEVPYPSWGDVGYFGSILWYSAGIVMLGKVIGLKFSVHSLRRRLLAILLPLAMLLASYCLFLDAYDFDWSAPLTVLLDFGYPFGQAIYVSLALLVFILTNQVLGGMMRGPALLLMFALVFQYLSDFMFLYQAHNGSWYVGGPNDYLYLAAYLLMTIGLIYVGGVFKAIQKSK